MLEGGGEGGDVWDVTKGTREREREKETVCEIGIKTRKVESK